MPMTAIDSRTALIVIDLQKGIVGSNFIHPIAEVIERNCSLIAAFRRHELQIVFVNVAGGAPGRTEQPRAARTLVEGWTELIPELDVKSQDIRVTKRTWGAFTSTDLDGRLKEKGVTQVVITGVATGTGVESTARQAYELGYNVMLAIDAMTDARPEAHAYSMKHIFPRLGETGTTQEIIELLDARSVLK